MNRSTKPASVCFVILFLFPAFAQSQLNPRDIAALARESVVSVTAYMNGEPVGIGSGFIFQADGVIATNLHVVQGADSVSVELSNGEIYDNVFVLGHDERRDIAVLQIPAVGLAALSIGDDRNTEVGDPIYVMGNPLGLSRTFSDGLLSAKRVEDGTVYLQISAPISEGSSGGPVLDSFGEVIGIATSFFSDGQNLNIAMPARHAAGLLMIAGDPIPFAASEIGESSFSGADFLEWPAIMELLSPDVREVLETMEPWEQQVGAKLVLFGAFLESEGWQLWEDAWFDALGSNMSATRATYLPAGNYRVFSVCDDDCLDIDLAIYDANQNLIIEDAAIDALPVAEFRVARPATYSVETRMYSCETEVCLYATGVWREGGVAGPISNPSPRSSEAQEALDVIFSGIELSLGSNWERFGPGHRYVVGSGEVSPFDVDLVPGVYRVLAVCDINCLDLDIAVFGRDGQLLGQDSRSGDPRPAVEFRVTQEQLGGSSSRVNISMANCARAECLFDLRLYRRR